MRDNSIVYAKAFAIMLMVLAHARFNEFCEAWINMFHMPLFFMMSGYCFKESHLKDSTTFLKRRLSGIYWPLVKWSILFIFLHNFLCEIYFYSNASTWNGEEILPYSIKDVVRRISSVIFTLNYNEQLLGGYWFLKELFIGNMFFYVFILLTGKKWRWGGVLLVINIVLLITGSQNNIYSGISVLAAVFIWIGYLIKSSGFVVYRHMWFPYVGFSIVTVGTLLWPASCISINAYNYISYVITATLGALSVLSICVFLDRGADNKWKKALRYIGDNTLTILTWHFLSFKFVSFMIVVLYDLPLSLLGSFPVIEDFAYSGWFIAYFLVGLLFPLSVASLNRYIHSTWLKI